MRRSGQGREEAVPFKDMSSRSGFFQKGSSPNFYLLPRKLINDASVQGVNHWWSHSPTPTPMFQFPLEQIRQLETKPSTRGMLPILVIRDWGCLHFFSNCHNRTTWLHKLDGEVCFGSWFQGISPSLWGSCSSQRLGELPTRQLQSRSRVTNLCAQPTFSFV